MEQRLTEKITLERLRAMRDGAVRRRLRLGQPEKHHLRHAEDGELPLCLQDGGADADGHKVWYRLSPRATPRDATAKRRRQ